MYHLIVSLRVLKYRYLLHGAERVLAYHEVLRAIYKLGFTVAGEGMKKFGMWEQNHKQKLQQNCSKCVVKCSGCLCVFNLSVELLEFV